MFIFHICNLLLPTNVSYRLNTKSDFCLVYKVKLLNSSRFLTIFKKEFGKVCNGNQRLWIMLWAEFNGQFKWKFRSSECYKKHRQKHSVHRFLMGAKTLLRTGQEITHFTIRKRMCLYFVCFPKFLMNLNLRVIYWRICGENFKTALLGWGTVNDG